MRVRYLLFMFTVVSLVSADTLTLRNGQTVEGSYLGGTSRQVKMAVGDSIRVFDVGDVLSISFEGGQPTAAAAPPQPAPPAAPARPAMPAIPAPPAPPASPDTGKILHVGPEDSARAATPATAAPAGTELPAGTNVTIRMIDDVDAKVAQVGQTFRGSIDDPVMLGDRVVIPKGADVVTKLVELQEAGKIVGGGQLTLDLVSVTLNGRPVDLSTQSVTQAGESGKKDSAKVIGGTAALGTIIGAIAGGGKGAAIGAISGAAAGTAVRVVTSGANVKIPAETRLTFTLQQPVRL